MITETKNDQMKVHDIDMDLIYLDEKFNSRGKIVPIDVVDLARSIKEVGLQSPVSIEEKEGLPAGKKYRLIAGHRRYIACKVNEKKTIPAMIKAGLSELQARTLNLIENLKRADLNILQEANALRPYFEAGWKEDKISSEVGMSRGWVQVRVILLKMPEPIQMEAAAGLINQTQIRQLYSMKSDEERFDAVKQIKTRLEKNEKVDRIVKRKIKPFDKKVRMQEEIFQMQSVIQENIGNSLVTVAMGWCGGSVSDYEFHLAIRETAKLTGRNYILPKELTEV